MILIFGSLIIGLILSIIFNTLGLLIINLLGSLLLISVTKSKNKKLYPHLIILLIIACFSVLIVYFGYISLYGIPFMEGGTDDLRFEVAREFIVNKGYKFPWELQDIYILGANNSKGYVLLLAWLDYISGSIGGYHTLMPRILNVYFLLSISVIVTKFISNNYNLKDKYKYIALYSVVLFPNMLFITVHVFRDVFVLFLIFSLIYIWDVYLNKHKIFKNIFKLKLKLILLVILTIVISYFLFITRYESLYIFIILFIIILFIRNDKFNYKYMISLLGVLIFFLFLFNFTVFGDRLLLRYAGYTDYRIEHSDGISNLVFLQPLFPFGIFLRIGYALITPFPIYILNFFSMFSNVKIFFNVLISLGTVIQILSIPFIVKSLLKIDKISLMFLAILIGISITTFTFRHFSMLYPFMFILVIRNFSKHNLKSIILNILVTSVIIMLLFIIYINMV